METTYGTCLAAENLLVGWITMLTEPEGHK